MIVTAQWIQNILDPITSMYLELNRVQLMMNLMKLVSSSYYFSKVRFSMKFTLTVYLLCRHKLTTDPLH